VGRDAPGVGGARTRGRCPSRLQACTSRSPLPTELLRAGVLRTRPRRDVPTPAFMPVGTKATPSRAPPGREVPRPGHILPGNTYHLHFRLGGASRGLGGLHAFMGWNGLI
jgi:queuine tRNA-ribosyltransferase